MSMKLNDLMAMSAHELNQLSNTDLREAYQNVRKIINSRINTFSKHGIEDVVPEELREGLGSSKGRENIDLVEDIKESMRWMRGNPRSTYGGYVKAKDHFRETMQEAMPDLDLSDEEKFDRFGRFMGDMQDRYGEFWHGVSNQVRDLYREAIRLNMNPEALMRNFDYWADHIADLESADPIRTKHERTLKPSEYARKLGLEKISGGRRK